MPYDADDEEDIESTSRLYNTQPDGSPPVFELYNAKPGCVHEIILPPGGGVKCKHCPGWFCY